MTMTFLRQNRDLQAANSHKFLATFGVNLSRFFDIVTGFDVVTFDEWLEVPDGVSTNDHLVAKWGQDATDLIWSLI